MGATGYKMDGGTLWSRGGLRGLSVEKDGVKMEIDDDLINDFFIETLRDMVISKVESMEAEELLRYLGLK